mmetsp:Transcript_25746/g.53233  ORF Transcript_25746/g.53233 Transcript_25746/m.53233 type:complete len:206 (-) Transcript_25746:1579-2196(-)
MTPRPSQRVSPSPSRPGPSWASLSWASVSSVSRQWSSSSAWATATPTPCRSCRALASVPRLSPSSHASRVASTPRPPTWVPTSSASSRRASTRTILTTLPSSRTTWATTLATWPAWARISSSLTLDPSSLPPPSASALLTRCSSRFSSRPPASSALCSAASPSRPTRPARAVRTPTWLASCGPSRRACIWPAFSSLAPPPASALG